MPETAIASAFVPRKPVVSADDSVQSVPLTLVVSDHEVVVELLQKIEGRDRDEYVLTALRIPANRRPGDFDFRHLAPHPHPDPMRRVPLFSGRLAIGLQDRVDKWNRWRKLRMIPFGYFPCRRYRAGKRLPHLSPVHAQLPRHRPDRARTVFVLPSDLLV